MSAPLPADLHTHTRLCRHATGTPAEYVREAHKKQLPGIGLSDHIPFAVPPDNDRMSMAEFETYCQWVNEAQDEGRARHIPVYFGIESEYLPELAQAMTEWLQQTPFDYVIGSVHYVNGIPFDHPDFQNKWQDPAFAEFIWESYFQIFEKFIKSNVFNIIGHFDLPKKFGFPLSSAQLKIKEEIIRTLFTAAAKNNMALEINTAGLRKTIHEIYPGPQLLQWARESQLPVAFGSDAHTPDETGSDFHFAVSCAKQAGYTTYAIFKNRERRLISL